jgi:hypothetical protein
MRLTSRLTSKNAADVPVGRGTGSKAFYGLLMALCVVAVPGLAWIVLNRTPFSGDESQYARASIELSRTLQASPLEWVRLLVTISPYKPSALIWLGQFFVPPGSWLGSIDRGLLFCTWSLQMLTLAVLSAGMSPRLLNLAERDGRASYPWFTTLWGKATSRSPVEKIDPSSGGPSPGRRARA